MKTGSHDTLVREYQEAFRSGDASTVHEILQFAKNDEALAVRLLAVENDLLSAAPHFAVDTAAMTRRARHTGYLHDTLDALEAWIFGHEQGLRSLIRFWPVVAMIVGGLCMYGLAQYPSAPASWWLGLGAIFAVGSITIVCSSSLWRGYPEQNASAIAANQRKLAKGEASGTNSDGAKHMTRPELKGDGKTYALPVVGLVLAASVASIVVLVGGIPSGSISDALSFPDNPRLIADGSLEDLRDGTSAVVRLRFIDSVINQSESILAARVLSSNHDTPLRWELRVVDASGNLVASTRTVAETALLSLRRDAVSTGELRAFIAVNDNGLDNLEVGEWALYTSGLEVEGDHQPNAPSSQLERGTEPATETAETTPSNPTADDR